VLDLASELGIIQRSGTWYSCGDVRLGQGRENARQYLKDTPETYERLRREILVAKGLAKENSPQTNTNEH